MSTARPTRGIKDFVQNYLLDRESEIEALKKEVEKYEKTIDYLKDRFTDSSNACVCDVCRCLVYTHPHHDHDDDPFEMCEECNKHVCEDCSKECGKIVVFGKHGGHETWFCYRCLENYPESKDIRYVT